VRLASDQWRGRQEKAARQHTNGVTVAHMFSGCEIELSESESRTAVFLLNALRGFSL
jgi:hypothetical protein